VILPKTNLIDAENIAENIRHSINTTDLVEISPLILSVSIGVVCYSNQEDIDSIIADADQLLYQAKESGRNRVVVA